MCVRRTHTSSEGMIGRGCVQTRQSSCAPIILRDARHHNETLAEGIGWGHGGGKLGRTSSHWNRWITSPVNTSYLTTDGSAPQLRRKRESFEIAQVYTFALCSSNAGRSHGSWKDSMTAYFHSATSVVVPIVLTPTVGASTSASRAEGVANATAAVSSLAAVPKPANSSSDALPSVDAAYAPAADVVKTLSNSDACGTSK